MVPGKSSEFPRNPESRDVKNPAARIVAREGADFPGVSFSDTRISGIFWD
jgi:hypothetical protein